MGIIVGEEIGRYDPYTDKFIKNTTTDRLYTKADMIAMLTDLQLEIEEIVKEEELIDKKWAVGLHYSEKIIQQKINTLKAESEET